MKNLFIDLLQYRNLNAELSDEAAINLFIKERGLVTVNPWHDEDIKGQANDMDIELTDEEIQKVGELMEHNFDATIGVNWDFISECINEVKNS